MFFLGDYQNLPLEQVAPKPFLLGHSQQKAFLVGKQYSWSKRDWAPWLRRRMVGVWDQEVGTSENGAPHE
jgi:hypothetical protein